MQLSETHPEILGEEAGEIPQISIGRRLGSAGLWILLVVGAVLARLCEG